MSGLACRCDHDLIWHHEHRGCGFQGFGAGRCGCTLPFADAHRAIVARAVNEALTEAALGEHCATCQCSTTECQDESWCKRTWRHRGNHSVIRDEDFT